MHHYIKRLSLLGVLGLAACSSAPPQTATAPAKANPLPVDTQPITSTHIIGSAKLIIGDVKTNQTYYEQMFGMKEVSHYSAKGVYDEPIMGFSTGARIALFSPLAEAPIKKSQFPVVLIYTPDFEGVVKRIEDAKLPILRLPVAQAGTFKVAIARDPSGNAVEIFSRTTGVLEVGGSKLIVNDRQKAEDFYVKVFGATPGQRYNTAAYDEVLMQFGAGPFLALFQPKAEAPLPKSQFPVVAIYTSDFDGVLKRVTELGLGYRDVKTSSPDSRIIIAKDPAGNSVEIIRRQTAAATTGK